MKLLSLLAITLLTAIASFLFVFGRSEAETRILVDTGETDLSIKITPHKTIYTQGEVVSLSLEIANPGDADAVVSGTDVKSGYIKLLIAGTDEKFKEYSHSAWIRGGRGNRIIKPGQIVASEATLFWNFKPKVSHLNAAAAKIASEGRILSDYAFDDAGVYFIKAMLIIPGQTQTRIESVPVQIVINVPSGEDLLVWNMMKGNGDLAYFIQEAETRDDNGPKREKLLQDVDKIVMGFPSSLLGRQLDDSRERFRAGEAARREFMDKLKKKQE